MMCYPTVRYLPNAIHGFFFPPTFSLPAFMPQTVPARMDLVSNFTYRGTSLFFLFDWVVLSRPLRNFFPPWVLMDFLQIH